MMRFEFASARRIVFGPGSLEEVGAFAADAGHRALVVTGRTPARAQPLLESLQAHNLQTTVFSVPGEPTVTTVQEGADQARQAGCDLVIACGGGSALDAGKAIAALLTNGGEPLDYLEVVGRGQPLTRPSAPFIAIPTTAGTGAEVTRNAVLGLPEARVKVSMRSAYMLPRLALVDPLLTHSMPPEVTASTGLDALTQLIEPFVSRKANPLTDGFCRAGLPRAARALRRTYEDGSDAEARQDMALASLLGGLALANAKLGAVHGFAGPLGGMFPGPHGAICARLLPLVMEANIRALEARAPQHPALERYAEVARLLTGDPRANPMQGVAWVRDLCRALQVPPLGRYGLTADDIPDVVSRAQRASSMQGNPITLRDQELAQILAHAL